MKKHINILRTIALFGVVCAATASCDDWLTIYPQDRIVEENFWEDKNDLDGVRYAAYKKMASSSMSKFFIWGDLRADAYAMNPMMPQDGSARTIYNRYEKIVQAEPDSSMTEFDWASAYTTINYCSKVLYNGPKVVERDPQLSSADWQQIKAEMVTLRALNYFYLLRAFKDIPYSTKVISKDSEVETFTLTNQLAVLDSCIYSIEGNTSNGYAGGVLTASGVGTARNRFANIMDTKGMITNAAIYAILSDMYLWRASLHEGRWGKSDQSTIADDATIHTPKSDYEKAAAYADKALAALQQQNEEESKNYSTKDVKVSTGLASGLASYGTPNVYLIYDEFKTTSNTSFKLSVFDELYTQGNSRESILELQISSANGTENNMVNEFYTYNTNTRLSIDAGAYDNAFKKDGVDNVNKTHDIRTWVNANNRLVTSMPTSETHTVEKLQALYCVKYASPQVFADLQNNEMACMYASNNRRNFIIYRMADMMLIKAEALACIDKLDKKTTNKEHIKALVNALHRRSFYPINIGSEKISEAVLTSPREDLKTAHVADVDGNIDALQMVMNERLIEFIGEGKRWFDLVRYAERNAGDVSGGGNDEREPGVNDGAVGVKKMVEDYMQKNQQYSKLAKTLISRMKNRYGLYCPIYEFEVKASNGAIQQNPVWNKSKYDK
ncbi:MAG: RagB/SusD family nutrient uptake outer membrane protein [Bacteroidaceae bacterium]|nr:RagB/SusD family nutrient uptake outer membrane protein [Bacteroidaceae bacterium]